MKELFRFERNYKTILKDITCNPYEDNVTEEEAIARRFMWRSLWYIPEEARKCFDDDDFFIQCTNTLATLLKNGGGTCKIKLHGRRSGAFAYLRVCKLRKKIVLSVQQ